MKRILIIFLVLTIIGIAIGIMRPFDSVLIEDDIFIAPDFEANHNMTEFNPYPEEAPHLSEGQNLAIEIATSNNTVSTYLSEGYLLVPGTMLLKEDFEKYGENFRGVLLSKNDTLVYVIVNVDENKVESIQNYTTFEIKSKTLVIEHEDGYSEIKATGFTDKDIKTVQEILSKDPKTAQVIKNRDYNITIQDMVYLSNRNFQNATYAMVILDVEDGLRYVVMVDITERKVFKMGRPLN
ncbi:hypothetical protein HNP90_001759 [Methanococcus maripaludis]|uniref:PepSY domain-containing protein n=2 Tax=Methanococcus maripaludis TaxID=39152 RepID=A0A7J9PHZ7_METMI|nr:hypothetical protein [Methanococcus maripaludis]MBA2862862.1 hypothetical protein [Methanococcus maripaludis]